MSRLLSILLSVVLGLWLGGLVALVCFVVGLFAFDRAVASRAVPVLFQTFATYHLIAAGAALLGAVAWRGLVRSRGVTAVLVLIGLAGVCAVASTLALGKMEQVRRDDPRENMMDQPAFRRMHAVSNVLYSVEALAVLGALVVVAAAKPARTAGTTEEAGILEPQMNTDAHG